MRDVKKTVIVLIICGICLTAVFVQAQKAIDVAKPTTLMLGAEDQKQLDLIMGQLAQLKPQLEAARKQQHDAQINLASANAFLAEYDKTEAIKEAFRYRIASDVCRCESKEVEFAVDGKSLIRKQQTEMKK